MHDERYPLWKVPRQQFLPFRKGELNPIWILEIINISLLCEVELTF